ncbi:MAG TPA: hypothetical protein VIC08_08035 [Cellvibrionaceae bacterium]
MSQRILSVLLALTLLIGASFAHAEIKKGDTLQTRVNLHPDPERKTLSTINYQLSGDLIAACTTVTVNDINRKRLVFTANGTEYTLAYDKNTRKAGVEFPEIVSSFFGDSCDQAKINSLSKADKDGIKSGTAAVGMSKDGVLIAMGPPPVHATSSLDNNEWMYWVNRFNRQRIEFNDKGIVTAVVN